MTLNPSKLSPRDADSGTSPGWTESVPWACSALRPRLWRLDAKAVFPLLVWLLHWSWWTLGAALFGILVLAVMDRTGLPPETCLERLRSLAAGEIRPLHEPGLLRRRAHW